MKNRTEEFKKFVVEQLKDFDEFREANPSGYVDDITDKAVKLFTIPDVSQQRELLKAYTNHSMKTGNFVGSFIDKHIEKFLKAFNCG